MLNLVRKEIDGQQVFDVEFMATSELVDASTAAAATLVYATLFTDARAPDGRAADGARGWWDNPDAGCGLWYVRRQALGSAARAEAVDVVRDALLALAPALSDVRVVDVTPAGTVSVVSLEVSGQHNGQSFSIGLTL